MTDNSWENILNSIRREAGNYSVPDKDAAEKSVHEERAKHLKNITEHQKIVLKGRMFTWIQCVVSLWLLFIVIFLCAYLYVSVFSYRGPILDKEIIITLLATTTINILGLPYVVTRGLFGSSN